MRVRYLQYFVRTKMILSVFFYNNLYRLSFWFQDVDEKLFDMILSKVSINHHFANWLIDQPTPFELLSDFLFECAMFIFDNQYDLIKGCDLEI